ncbi:MAG: glycoside hydrolase family 95-like protein [Bacteroidota bacterium]
MKQLYLLFFGLVLMACSKQETSITQFEGETLTFNELATSWDEAMPLGNGMVGNLVWQKEGKLRFSLDRADLWDLRPMASMDFDKWKYTDVYDHWKADSYREVQDAFDATYNRSPAPSKIPAGALEFDIESLGEIKSVTLDIETATCVVEWENGAKLTTFVHAEKPVGWYKFEHIDTTVKVDLKSPAYAREHTDGTTSQSRHDLNLLGYEQGEMGVGENEITYNQKGWGDFSYQVYTKWEEGRGSLTGCWSVSSDHKGGEPDPPAGEVVNNLLETGYNRSLEEHINWWSDYWSMSSVTVPDSILQQHYYLEMYKFGSVARSDTPPISLQAVWTADHGKLPPWKGDFHHDLNTQLSYWPAYTGNYLSLEEGFLNWLWRWRPAFKKYTSNYFEVDGMNVPGVTTLEGEPMGGWIQYSFGHTVSAWLSHHFYLHWRYSMDRVFLEKRAYPWFKDVAIFLDEISVRSDDGERKLRISSSPEIYNNSRKAWFSETTNFDLALILWTYEKAAELATELGLGDEAAKWTNILSEWPELAVDPETGLMFAPGFPYDQSHRHFSHLLGFHPLGLVDLSNGELDQRVIKNTLNNLEEQGSGYWTGYSFSWLGNLYARVFDGEKAAEALTTFAQCFCLRNSFHVNGDQCKAGHSNFTYRPFTLEGNFAFAAAIQEMLIQSHTGVVKLFPAIPKDWENAEFDKLRVNGAFLVSSEMKNGQVTRVEIVSEAGGVFTMTNPFPELKYRYEGGAETGEQGEEIRIDMAKGQKVVLVAIYFNLLNSRT